MGPTEATNQATSADGIEMTLARALAPEEIRCGDFVTMLHEVLELPSFLWCSDAALLPPERPVRIRFVPYREPKPWRVKAVCLPFVLVKLPCKGSKSLDVRKCRLARLDRGYATIVWQEYKRQAKRKRRRRAKGR